MNKSSIYSGEYEALDDWDGDEDEPYVPEVVGGNRNKSQNNADIGVPALTLKSISSKGRIVRSRWNTIRNQVK